MIRPHVNDPGRPMTTTIAKLAVEALIANGIEQRIEKMVVLNPGKAIELFDAVCNQRFDGEFGDCRCHRLSRVVQMRPDHSTGRPSS